MISVSFRKTHPSILTPQRATPGSAGFDLRAFLDHPLELEVGVPVPVPTGLFLEVPTGYEAQIRSRSGMSLTGVTVANSPGTVDSDYRGEVKVILVSSLKKVTINNGDRIAQLVISEVPEVHFTEVVELSSTSRAGGFGSTGVK